jgi:hypothetical protein
LPWQFWRMTPAEFLIYIEGFRWREDQNWQRTAWQTVLIVNHWRKKEDHLTIDDLLPEQRKNKQIKEPATDEQMAETMIAWALALGAEDRRKHRGAV